MARQNDAIQKAARNQRHMAFCGGFNGTGAGWLDDVFIWKNFQKISFFQDVFVKRRWELMSFVIGTFQGSFNYPFGGDQTMQT